MQASGDVDYTRYANIVQGNTQCFTNLALYVFKQQIKAEVSKSESASDGA